MKKYLILYYSKTGNSKFLAEKLAEELEGSKLKRIIPRINGLFLIFLLSALKIGVGGRVSREDIGDCDEVVIIGPIWGGLLISPLRSTIKKCVKASRSIHFAITCETSDEEKNHKYGYVRVLRAAEDIAEGFIKHTEAFPTPLVKAGDESWTPKLSEKVKITEENYGGAMRSRLTNFAEKIKHHLN